jgi:hypothetical protein
MPLHSNRKYIMVVANKFASPETFHGLRGLSCSRCYRNFAIPAPGHNACLSNAKYSSDPTFKYAGVYKCLSTEANSNR